MPDVAIIGALVVAWGWGALMLWLSFYDLRQSKVVHHSRARNTAASVLLFFGFLYVAFGVLVAVAQAPAINAGPIAGSLVVLGFGALMTRLGFRVLERGAPHARLSGGLYFVLGAIFILVGLLLAL